MKKYQIYLILLFLTSSCDSTFEIIDGFTQGTTYHIIYERDGIFGKSSSKMKDDIEAIFTEFDMSLSTYVPNSLISRINSNDTTVLVDEYFEKVFRKSEEMYKASDGAFDITVGPLVNAWGFGPDKGAPIDSSLIDSLLQYVGMEKVRISEKKIVKDNVGIKLDVNAIAQGYSVDVVCEFFDNKKIKNYLVEIGGELRSKGAKLNNEPWRVGVDKPYENNLIPGENLQVILKLEDCSLATSGNYRKFYEKDGIKYSHSIDPKSGYPVMDTLLSATIIAGDCMTADAFATACMVMGFSRCMKFIQKTSGIEAYLIYSGDNGEFKIWKTEGFKDMILKENEMN